MSVYVLAYVSSLSAFLALDAVWLGIMASRVYKPAMGDLVMDSFAITPAILFYLLYGIGLVVFAVLPALSAEKPFSALAYGALFGLLAYATYDLTNQATLRDWPVLVTVLDMAWGTIASGLAALAGYGVCVWFLGKA